jgi:hypothetical protein
MWTVFWGHKTGSNKIFCAEKKIIRIMPKIEKRVPYRELFMKSNILPLASELLCSFLLLFN